MKNLIAFFILLSAINVNANDLSSIQEDLVLEKNPVVIIWSHGQTRPQKSEKCSSRFNKIPKTLKYLEKEIINIVIQINGKKRSIIEANVNINEKDIIDKSIKDSQILKYIKDKKIVKTIYVKYRLLNLIVK